MDKIVIDLNDKSLLEGGGMYTDFSYNVSRLLMSMNMAGFDVPTSIKGTQSQIDAFFRALKNEKRYMDSYMKHGLGDSRTMMNKRDLDRLCVGHLRTRSDLNG